MLLRNQVEWAIHCCAVLGSLPPDRYLATKTLAEFHGVPKEYLSKALQALAQAGVLVGTLGPTGGYRLAKEAKDITFLDIVEAIEGKKKTFECEEIRNNTPCLKGKKKSTGVCAVARVMYRADEAWRKELRSKSLAELIQDVIDQVPADLLKANAEWLMDPK
ncbi:Rrf2 family transcriptional regulator [Bdellovibrio bacteriovorus]|uniref:Rrf2 family transcriptional regulator n=1 Tax=Bdellovibrio bacteriovorus TaxID=959 RepID=A0A150WRJ5_BDEBC|nr:Rrf2 family transcriptional regulator [Bdellovibrio bacteriovorus]KYG66988.1 Rrf2 family transcriptional regulator [Bdellovibrio bacteriovorus]